MAKGVDTAHSPNRSVVRGRYLGGSNPAGPEDKPNDSSLHNTAWFQTKSGPAQVPFVHRPDTIRYAHGDADVEMHPRDTGGYEMRSAGY